MNVSQNIRKILMNTSKTFKAQDLDEVVFEFYGNLLYASKKILCSASEIFKTMLSDRWMTTNEPIAIKNYSLNDFKEFLDFIYSGKCELTTENIFVMVDIAEFYGVKALKTFCEKYLLKLKLDYGNVFLLSDFASKYSLVQLKKSVDQFFFKNFLSILESEQFQCLPKAVVKDFVEQNHKTSRQEELFEAVYKWAEKRASENENNSIKEAIKEELADILPFIKFQIMENEFFMELIESKSFLFSDDQIYKWNQDRALVKVIDLAEKIMKGELCCPDIDKVADDIKLQKDKSGKRVDIEQHYCYWAKRQPKPSTQSKIIQNHEIDWYLIYDGNGTTADLAVKHRSKLIKGNYNAFCDILEHF